MENIKNGVYSTEEVCQKLEQIHEASESGPQEMMEDKMESPMMKDSDY